MADTGRRTKPAHVMPLMLALICFAGHASALRTPPLALARRHASCRHAPACARASSPSEEAADGEGQRQGRLALSVLAAAGAVETGFLSWDKLYGGGEAVGALCSATGGGCADVLSGPWASVSGVPLALFGLLAYSAMAALAASPLVAPDVVSSDDSRSGTALVAGSAAMASFSGCLMLLLVLVIREPCAFCITSAALSTSMFAVAWRSRVMPQRTDAAIVAAAAAGFGVLAGGALYAAQGAQMSSQLDAALAGSDGGEEEVVRSNAPPTIRTHSSKRALKVAQALLAHDARMFGAYWCSHCYDQKQTLGAEAFATLPYVECAADGKDAQRDLCTSVGIKGYPTWQIDGELYAGEKDLAGLEEILETSKPK